MKITIDYSYIIHLKPGRDKSVLNKHPWVFSGAVERSERSGGSGSPLALVLSSQSKPIGLALLNQDSQIQGRILLSGDDLQRYSDISEIFKDRIKRALQYRTEILGLSADSDSFRIFFSESDGIAGLIIDNYQSIITVQITSKGLEYYRDQLVEVVNDLLKPKALILKCDDDVRSKEGLPLYVECVHGKEYLSQILHVKVDGFEYVVDFMQGHKSGFYLDQRDNRQIVEDFCKNKEVLNLFSYTGGFAVHALASGAKKVTNVDTSKAALELLEHNITKNFGNDGLQRCVQVCGNAFEVIRNFANKGQIFDVLILDPPKLAQNKSQIMKASRSYKDLLLHAFKCSKIGSSIVVFSCSHWIGHELLLKIVFAAALDAGVNIVVEANLQQAKDHPYSVFVPQSLYLKGFVLRVV